MSRKKIGLALGGGGSRGLAHIGVLKVLKENNIPIDYVSGTSMGALIGAFFCSGMNVNQIEKEIISLNWKNLLDYSIPTKGLIKGKKIEEMLRKKLGNLDFKDLKIPLLVTAYDIKKDQEIIFSKGNVVQAIRASISIPGIFIPVSNKERILVDGGVVDPMPTEILKNYTDIIFGVSVASIKPRDVIFDEEAIANDKSLTIPGILKTTLKAVAILNSEVNRADIIKKEIDILINIDLGNREILDFKNPQEIISIGERFAKENLDKIRRLTKTNFLKNVLFDFRDSFEKNIPGAENLRNFGKRKI